MKFGPRPFFRNRSWAIFMLRLFLQSRQRLTLYRSGNR